VRGDIGVSTTCGNRVVPLFEKNLEEPFRRKEKPLFSTIYSHLSFRGSKAVCVNVQTGRSLESTGGGVGYILKGATVLSHYQSQSAAKRVTSQGFSPREWSTGVLSYERRGRNRVAPN